MVEKLDYEKRIVAEEAIRYVKDGMTVGLGSGSTVNWMLKNLGKLVDEGLQIRGIPSSLKTERLAKELGIPLTDFSKVSHIDIAIDGADEVDTRFNLLKGGGGSLVREKIIDQIADQLIIIVDESKIVSQLGVFPLPVEVLPFGWQVVAGNIEKIGGIPTLRKRNNCVFVSDNGNYILDCKFDTIENPKQLHERLKLLVGVVETGLFCEMTDKVIVSRNGHIEELLGKND